ncbi:MAG: glutathione S-transferase family protein [Alphaproteobacteria bacterium]
MYQLYQTTRSAAMSVHAALEEIGAPYTLVAVDLSQPRSAEHLALNPQGKVPVLVHDAPQGKRVLFQSAACLLYLADQHPEAKLVPPLETLERGLCYQWLFYMAESLQPFYLAYFYTDRHTADPSGLAGVKRKAVEQIDNAWALLDQALASGPYFLGKTFSIADLYMLTFSIWHQPDMRPMALRANVLRNLALVRERPAVQRMLQANGVT